MRAPLLSAALVLAWCTAACSKCSDDAPGGVSARDASELGGKDAPCELSSQSKLGDGVELAAGLTSRRLGDGRLVVGVALGTDPRAVVVGGGGGVTVQEPRRGKASGRLLRVTPALEDGAIAVLSDVRTADGRVECAAVPSADLSDCRSFASADGTKRWLVGSRSSPPRLVARSNASGGERELFTSDGPPFEDLRSEHLGEYGFVVSARYGGKVVMIRLEPDFALTEARSYGNAFGPNPELVSAGSGAMLLTTRRAFERQRVAFAQFADQHGHLPEHFDGSEHGLAGHAPRLASVGSQRFLALLDAVPGRLELLPVDATFGRAGPGQFVTAAGVKALDSAILGFDDGRVVVVYATVERALMAATLRCKTQSGK